MLLYVKAGIVVAMHDDNQNVAKSEYGDGTFVLRVSSLAGLSRVGDAPPEGEPDYRPFAAPEPTADLLAAYAAQRRFEVETGGITVGGQAVATDRASQAMVTGAYVEAQGNAAFTTQWKQPDGSFVLLTATQIIAIGQAVRGHVAGCFAAEAEVVAAITAHTATTWADVDGFFTAIA